MAVAFDMRWVRYRMCVTCLETTAQQAKKYRLDWETRYPPLFWGDFQKLVGRIGSTTLMARAINVAPGTVANGMRKPSSESIPPWMLRKLYEPLRGRFGSEWLRLLPTRVYLSRRSGRLLSCQRKSLLGLTSKFVKAKSSRRRSLRG